MTVEFMMQEEMAQGKSNKPILLWTVQIIVVCCVGYLLVENCLLKYELNDLHDQLTDIKTLLDEYENQEPTTKIDVAAPDVSWRTNLFPFFTPQRQSKDLQIVPSELKRNENSTAPWIPYPSIGELRSLRIRKKRKTRSRAVSAERFYTETEPTTASPIMVRQSRTKPTHSKKASLVHKKAQKFQERIMAQKESITSSEAFRRGYTSDERRNQEMHPLPDGLETFSLENTAAVVGTAHSACSLLSVHYVSDTSNYTMGRHPHYQGNGLVKVSGVYKDWKPAPWTSKTGVLKYFHLHQGSVSIEEAGVYLIYAQIHYATLQEVNGFRVEKNSEIIAQCSATSSHPTKTEMKSNTCSLTTTVLLHKKDTIHLKDLHFDRFVKMTPEKSYFGLIMLSSVSEELLEGR